MTFSIVALNHPQCLINGKCAVEIIYEGLPPICVHSMFISDLSQSEAGDFMGALRAASGSRQLFGRYPRGRTRRQAGIMEHVTATCFCVDNHGMRDITR